MHIIVPLILITVLSFGTWLVPTYTPMKIVDVDYDQELKRMDDILFALQDNNFYSLYEKGDISGEEYTELVKPAIQQTNDLIHYLVELNPPTEYKQKYIDEFNVLRNYKSYLLTSSDYVTMQDGDVRDQRYHSMMIYQKLGTK